MRSNLKANKIREGRANGLTNHMTKCLDRGIDEVIIFRSFPAFASIGARQDCFKTICTESNKVHKKDTFFVLNSMLDFCI